LRVLLDDRVRILLEGIEDILVAPLASRGTDELRRLVLLGRSGGGGGRLILRAPRGGGQEEDGQGQPRARCRGPGDRVVLARAAKCLPERSRDPGNQWMVEQPCHGGGLLR